jgi:branched-chain amino acid transport system ATP-binding protein
MSNDIILSVKGISKTFGGLKALVDVGFDIQRGEVYGIIGPNGSGKTTLINCITGFIKPMAGQVSFKGQDITGWPPHKIAHIGITVCRRIRTLSFLFGHPGQRRQADGVEVGSTGTEIR